MAEQKLLKLTIARVDEALFDGDVVSVSVPGIIGDMEILANHEPLISPIKAGGIKIKKEDGTTASFPVTEGTLEVHKNHATILV